ncbi:MAG: FHA domain-containing protein [Pseudomonadota bacterium]
MKALYSLKNLDTGAEMPVLTSSILIGRDRECDVVIDDEQLSRSHVRLTYDHGEVSAEDLQSTNGTFHNEKRIEAPVSLEPGDTLRIGSQTLLITMNERGLNRTVIGARVEEVSSYVLEQHSSESTAIRRRFPTPPGWTSADNSGLDRRQDEELEHALSERLASDDLDTSGAAVALLISVGHDRRVYLLPRGGSNWSLGRAPECDISVDDLTVSTHHATISFGVEGWAIEDQSSRNGVKINGQRRRRATLAAGDKIQLGRVEVLFRPL